MSKFYIFPHNAKEKTNNYKYVYFTKKTPFIMEINKITKSRWIMTEFHILMDQAPDLGASERILLTSVAISLILP